MADLESVPHKYTHKSTVDDIESDTGDSVYNKSDMCVDDVYNRYDFNRNLPDLPIVGMRDRILNLIEKNPIIVLEGATGCGKTTQVCVWRKFGQTDDC